MISIQRQQDAPQTAPQRRAQTRPLVAAIQSIAGTSTNPRATPVSIRRENRALTPTVPSQYGQSLDAEAAANNRRTIISDGLARAGLPARWTRRARVRSRCRHSDQADDRNGRRGQVRYQELVSQGVSNFKGRRRDASRISARRQMPWTALSSRPAQYSHSTSTCRRSRGKWI